MTPDERAPFKMQAAILGKQLSCQNCNHWDLGRAANSWCRLYPIHYTEVNSSTIPNYQTDPDSWCPKIQWNMDDPYDGMAPP